MLIYGIVLIQICHRINLRESIYIYIYIKKSIYILWGDPQKKHRVLVVSPPPPPPPKKTPKFLCEALV